MVQLDRGAFDQSNHFHNGVKETSLLKQRLETTTTKFTPTNIADNGNQQPRIHEANHMLQDSRANQRSRLRQRTIACRCQRANQWAERQRQGKFLRAAERAHLVSGRPRKSVCLLINFCNKKFGFEWAKVCRYGEPDFLHPHTPPWPQVYCLSFGDPQLQFFGS